MNIVYGLALSLPIFSLGIYIWAIAAMWILERSSFPVWMASSMGFIIPCLLGLIVGCAYIFTLASGVPTPFFAI